MFYVWFLNHSLSYLVYYDLSKHYFPPQSFEAFHIKIQQEAEKEGEGEGRKREEKKEEEEDGEEEGQKRNLHLQYAVLINS